MLTTVCRDLGKHLKYVFMDVPEDYPMDDGFSDDYRFYEGKPIFYVYDGFPHKSNIMKGRKYPSYLLPRCADIWGSLEDAISIGYRRVYIAEQVYVNKDEARQILIEMYANKK